MSWPTWLRPSRLFNRRTGLVLAWSLLVTGAAVAVNLAGVHVIGSVDGCQRWLDAHTTVFLAWRLMLYAATAYGWRWMRQRMCQREPEAHPRLLRTEIATVMVIGLFEASQLLRQI